MPDVDGRIYILERSFDESERAKRLLRDAGYGVTGTSLLDMVKEALADIEYSRVMQTRLHDADKQMENR